MSKIYKYRNFKDSNMKKIITNSALYFAHTKSFNDPYDCNLLFKQDYDENERNKYVSERQKKDCISTGSIKRLLSLSSEHFNNVLTKDYNKLMDSIGVLSLSQNETSILMWSHYASNHTGLVFEFDTSLDKEFFEDMDRINYNSTYPSFSYIKIEDIVESMMTKSCAWKYEEESRIIDLDKQGEKKFKKKALTGIIFGAKANNDYIQDFKNLCRTHGFEHISFKQAKIIEGSFKLKIERLDD